MSIKCTIKDGKFVQPCDALGSVTEYNHPKGKQKGVFAWRYTSPETGPTRTFYGCKSGERVERGLAFNYCPFCGERIDAPINSMEAA